ncbi:hypothetical protein [Alkaliphilus hydrothermalis]|uniref:DUF5673 domain-containing protein n=1 Tax=Alkaliphilus hydrothermalis TaxID=1482730 RepID=A0ABS2NMF2_9FIRM|nr:hypothetical protein [Alkaliphilus hydrothermalis]MBM7614122.1 hypothetical protein [Alkaliphilus hydrothermalis]
MDIFIKEVFKINGVILILFIFELYKTLNNLYRIKKYGGEPIEQFKHRSSIYYSQLFLATLVIPLSIIGMINQIFSVTELTFFLIYMVMSTISVVDKIRVYRNGLYYNGRFTAWNQMKCLEKYTKTSWRIDLKGRYGWARIIVLDEVEREEALINLLEQNILFSNSPNHK